MFKAAFLIVLGAVSGFDIGALKQLLLHNVENSDRSEYENCSEPSFKNITLSLYTRENPVTPIILTDDTINKLNKHRQTKINMHGWLGFAEWQVPMMNNYLKKADYNAITVDWSKYAVDTYPNSVCFLTKIAKLMSQFIVKHFYVNKVHLIGMSLGAQLSGLIGKEIYKKSGKKLNRVTGLDAAGPWFSGLTDEHRISPNDAKFVDAIHTNVGALGINHSYGKVNFYPNGGKTQLGCDSIIFVLAEMCSHGRSAEFMVESINSEKFVATSCTSYDHYKTSQCDNNPTIVMGENCPNSARGDYYLETNPEAPYAQGLKNSAPSTYGNLWPITFVMCIYWFFHLNSL